MRHVLSNLRKNRMKELSLDTSSSRFRPKLTTMLKWTKGTQGNRCFDSDIYPYINSKCVAVQETVSRNDQESHGSVKSNQDEEVSEKAIHFNLDKAVNLQSTQPTHLTF